MKGFEKIFSLLAAIFFFLPFSLVEGEEIEEFENTVFLDMNFVAEEENGEIRFTWDEVEVDNFQYYRVVRSETNPDPLFPEDGAIGILNGPSFTEFVDTKPEGTQFYRVCAIAETSRYCSSRIAAFNDEGDLLTSDVETECAEGEECEENVVISLDVEEVNSVVILNWRVAGEFPYGFKIIKSDENRNPIYPVEGDDEYIYLSSGNANIYVDREVTNGKTYFYRVCKNLPDGLCDEYSNSAEITLSVTVEEEPVEDFLTLTAEEDVKNGSILLTWEGHGDFMKGFNIIRSTEFPNPVFPTTGEDTVEFISEDFLRSFEDTDIELGETYHYRICQYHGNQECALYSNNVTITVTGEFSAEPDGPAFPDIVDHVYEDAITYVKNFGIVKGYSDGNYRPDIFINRAEFTKILIEAWYPGEADGENCFPDVGEEWFARYICLAKEKGIVQGRGDGNYAPNENVNFVEAAKILILVQYGFEPADTDGQWYEKYVRILEGKNYIPQTITSVSQDVTRAEMAELIYRMREDIQNFPTNVLLGE